MNEIQSTEEIPRFEDEAEKARHKGYQTLLEELVVERLYEEEKRAGIVG
jgi:hypothetical protein